MLRELPVGVLLYDILFDGREDVRSLPFQERRRRLEAWVARHPSDRYRLSELIPFGTMDELAALRASLDLAQRCERLGFNRFWVSEHHNSASIVGTAPEILMAAIAATTARIRVGSAGVMLPHYSALKVAEQFRVLEALAPRP